MFRINEQGEFLLMSELILDSESIYLRPISSIDTDNIIKWRNSQHVKNNFIHQNELTREEHEFWLKNKVEKGEVIQFIIVEKESDNPIGTVYLKSINHTSMKAEFGIFIGEEKALNKGYGPIATMLIVEYGFEKLQLNKIFLRVFEFNVRAIKSYKKANFIQEGLFRQDEFINNKFYDIVFMSILKTGDLND